jgi:hypothetical protein
MNKRPSWSQPAERDYVRLHGQAPSYLTRKTMDAVEADVDPATFGPSSPSSDGQRRLCWGAYCYFREVTIELFERELRPSRITNRHSAASRTSPAGQISKPRRSQCRRSTSSC